MPPKAPVLKNSLPDPKYADEPAHNDFQDEHLRQLLPYLALGFAPTHTPNTGNMCGPIALSIAYHDAREALKADGAIVDHATRKDFIKWAKSPEFDRRVDERVHSNEAYRDMSLEDRENLKSSLKQRENLDAEQLQLLLELANNEKGTNFVLGWVVEGWRCRWNLGTEQYDNDYLNYRASVYDTGAHDGAPPRPVIWLLNDDFVAKFAAWGSPAPVLNHWEAFGTKADEAHRQSLQTWGLGTKIRDMVNKGVWRVTKDCHKTPGGRELEVLAGYFVMDAPSNVKIAAGMRFVTGNGRDSGLVPEDSLVKVELDAAAPYVEWMDHLMNPTRDEIAARRKAIYDAWIASDGAGTKAAAAAKKAAGAAATGKSLAEQRVERYKAERTSNELQGLRQIPFNIYRAIRATDKAGALVDKDYFTIDDYKVEDGDFLLYITVPFHYQRPVTNLDGLSGEADARVLQPLESPWGFPRNITVTGPSPDFSNATKEECRAAKTRRGLALKNSDTLKQMRDAIDKWEDDTYMPIPLYKLLRAYTADEAQGNVEFMKGEIVHLFAKGGTRGDIMDFEGQAGRIRLADIERASNTSLKSILDHTPFGYRVEKKGKTGSLKPLKLDKSITPVQAAIRRLDSIKKEQRAATSGTKRPLNADGDDDDVVSKKIKN